MCPRLAAGRARTGALEQENSVSQIGLWYLLCSSITYWIVSVALHPYLCVAMKSTVSSPQPGCAKNSSNQSIGAWKQLESWRPPPPGRQWLAAGEPTRMP